MKQLVISLRWLASRNFEEGESSAHFHNRSMMKVSECRNVLKAKGSHRKGELEEIFRGVLGRVRDASFLSQMRFRSGRRA